MKARVGFPVVIMGAYQTWFGYEWGEIWQTLQRCERDCACFDQSKSKTRINY